MPTTYEEHSVNRKTELKKTANGSESWTEVDSDPEFIRTRQVLATPWEVQRINCYCCSCTDLTDPDCRLHSFRARRGCEEHGQPASAPGLATVQEQRATAALLA